VAETLKILVHSKEPSFIEKLSHYGLGDSYELIPLPDITNLIQAVYDEMPHLVVAELRLSNVGAFDICSQMKTDIVLGHIPLIIVTDSVEEAIKTSCGADAFLAQSDNLHEITQQIQLTLSTTRHELDINPLTRLPGSRTSVEEIESLLENKTPFIMYSVHLRNVDYLYKRFGTRQGDNFVRLTANMVSRLAKETGGNKTFIGHLGAQNFVVASTENKTMDLPEKLIEGFEASLNKITTASHQGPEEPTIVMTIAILNNRNTSFNHIAEMAKASEQIHWYLRRFPHSAYLQDRRSSIREVISDIALEGRFPKAPKAQKEASLTQIERSLNKSTGLFADIIYFLKNETVETHFQPIVAFKDKSIYAYEALSRFKKADGTFIEPVRMFQGSREINLIKEFDILCALTALKNARNIPPESKLFINLNRETLLDSNMLAQILEFANPFAGRLVIEITEQSLLRELVQLIRSIEVLREQGIEVALDDAGGGSVSLREAAQLRPDYVKFDLSLIQDIATSEVKQRILSSLMVFFKSIHTTTVAEGIETRADWDYLMKAGIRYGQGFLIAKPTKDPVTRIRLKA